MRAVHKIMTPHGHEILHILAAHSHLDDQHQAAGASIPFPSFKNRVTHQHDEVPVQLYALLQKRILQTRPAWAQAPATERISACEGDHRRTCTTAHFRRTLNRLVSIRRSTCTSTFALTFSITSASSRTKLLFRSFNLSCGSAGLN